MDAIGALLLLCAQLELKGIEPIQVPPPPPPAERVAECGIALYEMHVSCQCARSRMDRGRGRVAFRRCRWGYR